MTDGQYSWILTLLMWVFCVLIAIFGMIYGFPYW
jgi:hypothetical protein